VYLSQFSAHGYMVYRQINDRFPAWGTSRSTIYDQLSRLEQDGLIEEAPEEGKAVRTRSRGPIRYRLSVRGAEALEAFLRNLDLADAPRQYFVLALLHATWQGPEFTARLLDDLEQRVLALLDEIGPAPRPERLTELGGWGLVKDQQLVLSARLTWIEKMRQASDELTKGAGEEG
jgi:DNA-binding PadR family transcriptional regulator